ncbi:acyl transferase/acyl hydrolase/lysophospholipase [Rostrohypoxylon terebratum]|nr:acyl transferase/acyl hydrolase/lysophospholipase [Rostrohypoxylon terebratum]
MEQSYNKPVLPHVILAFNKNEDAIETSEEATRIWMDVIKNLHTGQTFKRFAEYWGKQYGSNHEGKPIIDSGEALLKCYYASVRVIHFSDQTRPTQLHKQIDELYRVAQDASAQSQRDREAVGMKLNAATLPLYVRLALKQFSSSLDKPFDFGEAWFELNPVSFEFSSTILTLAKLMRDCGQLNGIQLWKKLGHFVASCFHLSSCRKDIAGSHDDLNKKMWSGCESAASNYWSKFWPCEKVDSRYDLPCKNAPNSHVYHQYCHGKHSKNEAGTHIASHSKEDFLKELEDIVAKNLRDMAGQVSPDERKDRAIHLQKVTTIHKKNVQKLYGEVKNIDDCVSHSACLWCLDEIPEHSLPCGHTICSPCLMAVGKPRSSGGFFYLDQCPLTDHRRDAWQGGWIGMVKPSQAGVRTLTLDGGGIRGIIELEILTKIQAQLGEIPLREFFDLIVGTSAGGIIALGLGAKKMDLTECKRFFEEFSKEAFSVPKSAKFPLIGRLNQLFYWGWNHGKFQAEPLEKALKLAFGEDASLFGGVSQYTSAPAKTAVTATTLRGHVVVLSNYNRRSPNDQLYHFQRSGHPDKELLQWEAARATSAAPFAFKPFSHTPSGQVYVDGGLYHNNPVAIADAERKAIWTDKRATRPDIILSLGTGSAKLDLKTPPSVDTSHALEGIEIPEGVETRPYLMELATFGYDHIKNGLDCDQLWQKWLQTRSPEHVDERRRYRRLTVTLDELIEMDAVKDMDKCRTAVENWAEQTAIKDEIEDIVDQLIASCFYYRFEQGDIKKIHVNGKYQCLGTIECRLLPGKEGNIVKLGVLLKNAPFSPKFVIKETHKKHKGTVVEISEDIISRMIGEGQFSLTHTIMISHELAETEISMELRNRKTEIFPISGFPRKLQQDHEVVQIDTSTSIDHIFTRVTDRMSRILHIRAPQRRMSFMRHAIP